MCVALEILDVLQTNRTGLINFGYGQGRSGTADASLFRAGYSQI